jgi:purine nucleosidase
MERRIVLDTDMGSDVDDALCLALALASPEIELVAVTHVTRDTHMRARISRKLLDLAGFGHVPVYAGQRAPLVAPPERFVWFGNEGVGILESDGDGCGVEAEDAVEALLRLFGESGGLELVAVGPMTNLAVALQRDPSFASRVAQLTIMGGHVREIAYAGRIFPYGVDYNLCSDPEASLAVLTAGMPTRLVTGDVTLQTWMTRADLDAIRERGGLLRQALVAAVNAWTPIMYDLFGGSDPAAPEANVAFLHDPLALVSVFDESFCTFEDLAIQPTITEGVFRTIERDRPSADTVDMRCATAVDAPRFRELFVDRLRGLGPR